MIDFIAVVLGHFVGDFLLQNKWMALSKTKKGGVGYAALLVHCVIYALSIAIITWHFEPLFVALVFASHLPLDRWSLATKWLRIIKARTMPDAYRSVSDIREFDIAFAVVIYIIADSTIHLLLLWAIVNVLTWPG
jgi:hypothetical protein